MQTIFSQKSCMGWCIVMLKYPPLPSPPPTPLRRCLGMKGMTTYLETLSLYQPVLTFPLRKNTHTHVCFYKSGNFKAIKPLLWTFFFKWQLCSNLPQCEESWNILNFKIIKWQFCSNVCLVRISVSRKTKVNLRPRKENAKSYRCI